MPVIIVQDCFWWLSKDQGPRWAWSYDS